MYHNNFWNPQLVIPRSFQNCLTYEKQILWLYRQIMTNGVTYGHITLDPATVPLNTGTGVKNFVPSIAPNCDTIPLQPDGDSLVYIGALPLAFSASDTNFSTMVYARVDAKFETVLVTVLYAEPRSDNQAIADLTGKKFTGKIS